MSKAQCPRPSDIEGGHAYWVEHAHHLGVYEFRPATGEVLASGRVLAHLNEAESETLNLLINAYPLPVPRARLIHEMRRIGCYCNPDTTKAVVRRIRKKLGAAAVSTHARGYQFNAEYWMGAPSAGAREDLRESVDRRPLARG